MPDPIFVTPFLITHFSVTYVLGQCVTYVLGSYHHENYLVTSGIH
jgi:hypothetical protein